MVPAGQLGATFTVNHQPFDDTEPSHLTSTIAGLLPNVGGAIGGFVGGIPGAAMGGAAGKGYGDILQNIGQIGPAIRDVSSDVMSYPKETLAGFAKGSGLGAASAAVQGGFRVQRRGLARYCLLPY